MSSGGGGGDTNIVTYTNRIPTYIPNFQDWTVAWLDAADLLSQNNYVPYTGLTYAAQTQDELNGITAIALRGSTGSPIEADGETYLRALLADTYLYANHYLSDAFDKQVDELVQDMNERILPTINNAFVFAFGGSEHNIEEAKAAEIMMGKINDITNKVYYGDYRIERRLQDDGLSHTIPYGQREIRDAEIQRQSGLYAREYLQGEYKDAWDKWAENQILPVRNLDILGNAVRTILGTQINTKTTYYNPPKFAQIAGMAITGLALYSMYKGTSLSNYQKDIVTKSEPTKQVIETNEQFSGNMDAMYGAH